MYMYIHNVIVKMRNESVCMYSGLCSECTPVKSLSSGSRAGMSTGVNSHVAVVLTIGYWGDELLPLEYNLGVCLSRAQRAHSVDPGRRCSPGKASEHVLHLVTSSVVKCVWNFVIFA